MNLNNLPIQTVKNFARTCPQDVKFLGIDGWYKYMPRDCSDGSIDFSKYNIGSIWLILAGVIDILLRIGTLVAVFYFIWGAIKMITSQGSPEGIKNARSTMTNALIGLVVSVVAAQLLSFFLRSIVGVGL